MRLNKRLIAKSKLRKKSKWELLINSIKIAFTRFSEWCEKLVVTIKTAIENNPIIRYLSMNASEITEAECKCFRK